MHLTTVFISPLFQIMVGDMPFIDVSNSDEDDVDDVTDSIDDTGDLGDVSVDNDDDIDDLDDDVTPEDDVTSHRKPWNGRKGHRGRHQGRHKGQFFVK